MDKIKVGFVGLGQRGSSLIGTVLAIDKAEIIAVCDAYTDRVDSAAEKIKDKSGREVKRFTDFDEMLKDEEIEFVVVSTSWETHIKFAVKSMLAGKITAMEVGGAYSIDECYELVAAYEKTKTPFMFLENCCYDKFELLSTALVRAGKLGTIVHCHGAYAHDLRAEVLGGNVNRHYRLNNYLNRNCENYPTHELGPIAKILGINRGNRMVSLVSVASKSVGMEEFALSDKCPDKTLAGKKFKQGDIVNTIITCENGETITLRLDTSLPRYYSREFTVHGSKGLCVQESNMVMIEGDTELEKYWEPNLTLGEYLNNAEKYGAYLPALWNITDEEKALGHGGMDYIMFKDVFNRIAEGKKLPIDVYDAAAWMCITALSEKSVAENGAPQEIPDFTRGEWKTRPVFDVAEFPKV